MFKRLIKDSRGVAAVEFALAVPFLLALFVGSTDLLRLLLINQKTERVAYTAADLSAQTDVLTAADIQQIFLAPNSIMEPFAFGANGLVIISSVHRADANSNAITRWRCAGGGTLAATSRLGNVNMAATLPGGLTINARENVIVAEVFYVFNNWLPVDFVTVPVIYKTAVFKPRFGSLLTAPC